MVVTGDLEATSHRRQQHAMQRLSPHPIKVVLVGKRKRPPVGKRKEYRVTSVWTHGIDLDITCINRCHRLLFEALRPGDDLAACDEQEERKREELPDFH